MLSRFDRIILATVLALALAIAGLTVALARFGPTTGGLTTASTFDGAVVNTQLVVSFSQPMRDSSVQRHFHIYPRVAGSFTWSGNEMLFLPAHNLAYSSTYDVSVDTGAEDSSGQHLGHRFQASFHTQAPHLMYLGTAGAERNRLVLATAAGARRVIGPNDGSVTSYSVSQDHTLVTYVRRGAPHERSDEIWLLSLSDNSTQRVFRKPDWSISQVHLSPDDRYIVFLATHVRICQAYYGCYRNIGTPLVYFVDLHSHAVFPFHSRSDVPITNFIDFSPHGQIAYTDLGSALTLANPAGGSVVHIPNGGNSLEFSGFDPAGDRAAFVGQTPSSTGGDVLVFESGRYRDISKGVYDSASPAFSSSGNLLAYSGYRGERGIQPVYGINVYNLKSNHWRALPNSPSATAWAPQWSLDDRYIAYVRSAPQEAMYLGSGQIWVMHANGGNAHEVGPAGTDISWVS